MKRTKVVAAVIVFSFISAGAVFAIDLPGTAKAIKSGKIHIGKTIGMQPGERFHNIHNKELGLQCQSCHISSFAPDYVYQKKYKDIGGMGHVDRGICLGCHKENGPAVTKLYGTAER
jgi:hypothetical protein